MNNNDKINYLPPKSHSFLLIDDIKQTLDNLSNYPCELDLDIVQGETEIELACFLKPNTQLYIRLKHSPVSVKLNSQVWNILLISLDGDSDK